MAIENEEIEEEVVESGEAQEETTADESSAEEETQDPHELIRAMKADREGDQAQIQSIRQQNELLTQMMLNTGFGDKTPSQSQANPKFADDDILTYAEMKQILDERLTPVDKNTAKIHGQISEENARRQYPDYDDVLEQLVVPMVKANPKLIDIIDSSPNPALMAYRLGTSSEAYIAYQRQNATKKVADKIEKNLSKPKTLSGAGQTSKPKQKSFSNMSSAEFAKIRQEMLGF